MNTNDDAWVPSLGAVAAVVPASSSRATNRSKHRKAYPSETSRSRLARSGGSRKGRSGETRNRSRPPSLVAGTSVMTSPGTPNRASSTSGTMARLTVTV